MKHWQPLNLRGRWLAYRLLDGNFLELATLPGGRRPRVFLSESSAKAFCDGRNAPTKKTKVNPRLQKMLDWKA